MQEGAECFIYFVIVSTFLHYWDNFMVDLFL